MFSFGRFEAIGEEENRFRAQHAQRSVPFIRVSLPLTATLYLLFLGWDYYIDPHSLVSTLSVRLPISLFAVIVIGMTYMKSFERWAQTLLSITVVLGAVGIVLVLGILPNGFSVGMSGLLLVVMYACGATRLLTGAAIITCVVIIALTNGMLLFIEASTFQFINTNFFLIAASVIGLVYTRLLESMERRSFRLEEGQRKNDEAAIYQLAFHDPLTNLPNRRLLMDRLRHVLSSRTCNTVNAALLFIDIDNFKTLNDIKGHNIGDMLLIEIAHRLHSCAREGDTVARIGGDEFVVMLEGLSPETEQAAAQANAAGEQIRQALHRPYQLKEFEYLSSCSIGISMFSQGVSAEDLFKNADTAMHEAKKSGRNTLRFFDPEMQAKLEARSELEIGLREAWRNQEFRLYYQMQVNYDGRVLGAEVLLRWFHPERGLISPLQFIPLAEETGLILPIGQWVLETACAQLKTWEQDASTRRDLVLAVNVSAKQFRQADFVAQVQAVVRQHVINPAKLKLELTESMLQENIEDTIAKMNDLKAMGVQFSLDDFGTGYSSLTYLKRLPLDQVKIDQSFVRNLTTDKADEVMVMAIVDLGMNFEVDVIAEGVETEAQLELLHRHGCFCFQGYLFSKPVPVGQFEELLKQG